MIEIEVRETTERRGRFQAYLGGQPLLKKPSRTPLCDAARVLIAEGEPRDAVLVMWHRGVKTMWVKLGEAARLTVEESDQRAPRFRPYQPDPRFPAGRGSQDGQNED
jgi:hypothetical protein